MSKPDWENGPPCAVHELRLQTVEKAVEALADSTKRLELLAARAAGVGSLLMIIQPIITGLVLYWLLRLQLR